MFLKYIYMCVCISKKYICIRILIYKKILHIVLYDILEYFPRANEGARLAIGFGASSFQIKK